MSNRAWVYCFWIDEDLSPFEFLSGCTDRLCAWPIGWILLGMLHGPHATTVCVGLVRTAHKLVFWALQAIGPRVFLLEGWTSYWVASSPHRGGLSTYASSPGWGPWWSNDLGPWLSSSDSKIAPNAISFFGFLGCWRPIRPTLLDDVKDPLHTFQALLDGIFMSRWAGLYLSTSALCSWLGFLLDFELMFCTHLSLHSLNIL